MVHAGQFQVQSVFNKDSALPQKEKLTSSFHLKIQFPVIKEIWDATEDTFQEHKNVGVLQDFWISLRKMFPILLRSRKRRSMHHCMQGWLRMEKNIRYQHINHTEELMQ